MTDLDRAATDALAAIFAGALCEECPDCFEMARFFMARFRSSPRLQAWAIRAAGGEQVAWHRLYRFPPAVVDALASTEPTR